MKGIVFTELLELVEEKFGAEVVDVIIEKADLPNAGAYTAVGTYDHVELVRIVQQLSELAKVDFSELVKVFGEYLFGRLVAGYPVFLEGTTSAEQMLRSVHDIIHVEVQKLYPEAELPSFGYDTHADGRLIMHYQSSRGFADLAEGLITGCAKHFNESAEIEREDLSGGKCTDVRFTIRFGALV
ncbi:MAG: heme NO-binding domain-containing protein [Phycisphaeraceae bacterium]|nr:heme NO-binding domain-containing protein [Phycisphaeraceae bacterium]